MATIVQGHVQTMEVDDDNDFVETPPTTTTTTTTTTRTAPATATVLKMTLNMVQHEKSG